MLIQLQATEEQLVYETDSEDYREHVEFLQKVGEGGNGAVQLVRYKGQTLVSKTPLYPDNVEELKEEADMLRHLEGAGGAPLLRAVYHNPPALLMTYTGTPYDQYLSRCSDREILNSLAMIGRKLEEIHDKEVIHNDVKHNNVTVTEEPELEFHIIDLGLSTRSGHRLQQMEATSQHYWMSPELLAGRHISRLSDVYSFGQLIYDSSVYGSQELWNLMEPIYTRATKTDPRDRCSLSLIIRALQVMADSLDDSENQDF